MNKFNTSQMLKYITENTDLKFKTNVGDKEVVAYYNKNKGVSIGRSTLVISGNILNAEWELLNKRFTFMEAVNSNTKIKYETWGKFISIQEALYELIDFSEGKVINLINGHWNIENES